MQAEFKRPLVHTPWMDALWRYGKQREGRQAEVVAWRCKKRKKMASSTNLRNPTD